MIWNKFKLTISIVLTLWSVLLYAREGELPAQAGSSEQTAELASANKLLGQIFLAKNMSRPGVITLPDGLQYRILKAGEGLRPTANDTVTVHYLW